MDVRVSQEKDLILQKMSRFKVVELQQTLAILKLSKAGRKAELFERLKGLFYNSPQNIQVVKNAVDLIASRSSIQSHSPYGMTLTSNPQRFAPTQPHNSHSTPYGLINKGAVGPPPSFRISAPVIPSVPIQIPPQVSYEDLKQVATYSVGASGLKPPVIFKLKLDNSDLEKLQSLDPVTETKRTRLLLYSCQTSPPTVPPNILAFPDGLSISCNGVYAKDMIVTGSFIRPPDLTSILNLGGENEIKIAFYSQNTTFRFMFKLVQLRTDTEVLNLIKENKISKEDVLKSRYENKDKDDDIVSGLETVTLRDPYTRSRIAVPVRGRMCIHVQCFDAPTFILISKTAKKRECPVCYKPTSLEDLVFDGYFEDILSNTDDDVESVEIGMDGNWSLKREVKPVVEDRKSVNEVFMLDSSPNKPAGYGNNTPYEIIDISD